MPPLLQSVTYLRPPNGPALVLTDNETWLGRNSFELSEKGQILCSRKQACLKITNTTVILECHGLNPICFVICRSVNFQAREDAPTSRLYQLKKGEVVELAAGDKFFLAPKECLLTVGIESGCDEAAADAGCLSDDKSLAHEVCWTTATQQGLSTSPAEQHRVPLEGEPTRLPSTDAGIGLDDRRFTKEISDRNQTVHNCLGCTPSERCECNILKSTPPAVPSGLQGPLPEDRCVIHNAVSNGAVSRDPTPGEVVIPITRSIDVGEITAISNGGYGPDPCGLDSLGAGDRICQTPGATLAAGSSVEGMVDCSNNDSKANLDFEGIYEETSGSDPRWPAESQRITTGNVSAFSGGTVSCAVRVDTRRSPSPMRNPFVSGPGIRRVDSYAGVEDCLNPTEGIIGAAGSPAEGRICTSRNKPTVEIGVENIRPRIMACLDSGSPTDLVVNCNPDANEAGNQISTRNASGCTSPALCVEPHQNQDDVPSASIFRSDPQNAPLHCGLPVSTKFTEQAAASVSRTIAGNHRVAEISEMSTERVKPPPEPGSSSRGPILIDSCNELPTTTFEAFHVNDARELGAKQPELIVLSASEDEGNSEVQVQAQSAEVAKSMSNNSGTGPIEGMEEVIVTVSGYEDRLRARLINLISATGASYTGSLTKLNTHVVCWKFRGAKYEMANKLGKFVINHRWFEDCLREGKRLPEGPYKASGEMSEPLSWYLSSVHHASPTAAVESHRDYGSLSSREQYVGQARAAGPSGQSASTLRGEIGALDRGKRLLDLNGPASEEGCNIGHPEQGSEVVCQLRTVTGTRNAPANDVSTRHHAQEQESDDFWNEVIRACDDRKTPAPDLSCQVLSVTNHSGRLKQHITGTARRPASPRPGSSLRELDPEFYDEVRNERRHTVANEAGSSRVVQGDVLEGTGPSHSFVGEQSDNSRREVDRRNDFPEVFQRKRKQASASTNFRGKHRRLVRKFEVPAASEVLPNQVESTAGIVEAITAGDQPNLNTDMTQQRASTVDTEDGAQNRVGVTEIESVGRSGEKAGVRPSSDEIACVICHSETKPTIEGVLACGHKFCYPCIQRWADEVKSKSPTCPLCKVPFDFITLREMAKVGEDGSCAVLEERIVQIGQQSLQETRTVHFPTLRNESLCVNCGSRDTPELLLICTNCGGRACHTFCLDPPRPPGSAWYCNRCFQNQSRNRTREAYGRLFQGSPPPPITRREHQIPDAATNLALQSSSTTRVGASGVGQSSSTAIRRARQGSLHHFLVRRDHE